MRGRGLDVAFRTTVRVAASERVRLRRRRSDESYDTPDTRGFSRRV